MDYCLNAGDGAAALWTSPPDVDLDGDGELDAVRMDLDGDGLFDDALGDLDDDGTADHAAYGLSPGGEDTGRGPDRGLYTDDGTGTWALAGGGAGRPVRWFDLDGVAHEAGVAADVDGDGQAEELRDVDRDGLADRALTAGGAQGYVDTDGDGRWDLLLADIDGDGAADSATWL